MLGLEIKFIIFTALMLGFGIPGIVEHDKTDVPVAVNETNTKDALWRNCDLAWEEMPGLEYFVNGNQSFYNYTTKGDVASIVFDYAQDAGIGNEKWELKQIYHFKEDVYQAYTESDMGSELYIVFTNNTPDAKPCYIIAADIRKTEMEDTVLYNEGYPDVYSYNSMLDWYSYEKWFYGEADMEEKIKVDIIGNLYDSSYGNNSYYAIYDYLDRFGKDKEFTWEIDENTSYTGHTGMIACMSCTVGSEKVNLFLDMWNKRYAVLK